MASYILDACAMIAVLANEPGADVVDEVYGKAAAGEVALSIADSIALAQAMVTGGELLTADHHEFDVIEGKESISFCWIR